MTPTFRLPFGERGGQLVHIGEVPRGKACDCVCPSCKVPLVARKGQRLSHHFAHAGGQACNPETALHVLGKRLLFNRLEKGLQDGLPVLMEWECDECHTLHSGNIIKIAAGVALERSWGPCRPDITVLRQEGLPAALVEIVVSHEPEENVFRFAESVGCPVVEFHLKDEGDLERITNGSPLRATKVNICTKPKCKECGGPMYSRELKVVDHNCWSCGGAMRIAFLDIGGETYAGPEGFSSEEVDRAWELGAVLKREFSKTVGSAYLANTCPNCKKMTGNNYLLKPWLGASYDPGESTGVACPRC